MSASYFGTFPVTVNGPSYVDQNGIRYASQKITARINDYASSVPEIGSDFLGDSTLRVVDTDVSFGQNGLAEIMVKAAGPASGQVGNVRLLPGAPLIYGLAGSGGNDSGLFTSGGFVVPKFSPSGGLCVNVSFVALAGEEASIVSSHSGKIMPDSVAGVTLPSPSRAAGDMASANGFLQAPSPYTGSYYGFVCSEISTQTYGSAMLVNLYYKEKGFLFSGGTKLFEY